MRDGGKGFKIPILATNSIHDQQKKLPSTFAASCCSPIDDIPAVSSNTTTLLLCWLSVDSSSRISGVSLREYFSSAALKNEESFIEDLIKLW